MQSILKLQTEQTYEYVETPGLNMDNYSDILVGQDDQSVNG